MFKSYKKFFLSVIIVLLVMNLFSQENKADSLYFEFQKQNDDSIKTNILINILEELTNNTSDTLIEFYIKHKDFINEKGTFFQQYNANSIIGIHYRETGIYDEALKFFNLNIKLSKLNNDSLYLANSYGNIGNVFSNKGHVKEAINAYKSALAIFEKINNTKGLAMLYGALGNLYLRTEDFNNAIENYKKSRKSFSVINYERGIALNDMNIGIAYKNIHKNIKSIEYFNKAEKSFVKLGDNYSLARVYGNFGSLYFNLKKYDKALFYNKKSLAMSNLSGMKDDAALSISAIGKCYFAKHNYEKAIMYGHSALDTVNQYSLEHLKESIYFDLYKAYKKTHNYQNAVEYLELYKTITDSVLLAEKKDNISKLLTEFETKQKEKEIKLLQKEQEVQKITLQKEQEKSKFEKMLIISVLGFVILAIVFILFRLRQKQKNKINSLEKRSLKVETQMLRSQMNPHFIFNSLNSIQSFISNNETIDAERYLSKFAKLMRLILDNSRKSFITLENEINTLKLYLELEKLRFDNRFNYKININDIEDEFTLIPPMLAQPYIENAILHGVASKKNGQINIDFLQKNNKIICTVDDNGIGRKKAEEISNKSSHKKTSLGIKVTQERIELLKEENNINLTVKIIDKYDDNNMPIGTQVIVEMPFKE